MANKELGMKVCVTGLGYMGLPMAALLAKAGHEVLGVDINPAVVMRVNEGRCPFAEKGMSELVAEAHASGRLRAAEVPEEAEIFLLSLPTPVDHVSHKADMAMVEAGVESIAPVLQGGELVILESTSPVGATATHCRNVVERLRPELANKVDYVFCPERAIPGDTLREMVGNDRLVGGLTPEATARGVNFYKTFCKGELLPTSSGVAEMVKLVENASRDVQIAFANELSLVCHELGLDVREVIRLANHHPRVNILQPGAGVGGHCIAVDPWFIVDSAPEVTPLMRTARAVNDGKPLWVARQVMALKPKVVACLGLAYKPDVDDLRESPSITVVNELVKNGVAVRVVEPHLGAWTMPLVALEDAVREADVVVTLTGHSAFKALEEGALAGKTLLDAAGIYAGRDDFALRIG